MYVVYVVSAPLSLVFLDMGSGQFPMATEVLVDSAREPADRTAGAAAEKARAPASTAAVAIFFNINGFLNTSRIRYKASTVLVDIHCKMFSTGTVKHFVRRPSGKGGKPVGNGFGEKLRAERLERGLTQAELGKDLYSPSYISLLETGRREPTAEVIEELARRLELAPKALEAWSQPISVSDAEYVLAGLYARQAWDLRDYTLAAEHASTAGRIDL